MKRDDLGDRMKEYERVTRHVLTRRTPTIIRVDGKAFHTWVKQISKELDPSLNHTPFSLTLSSTMLAAVTSVMEEMQNSVFAYTQSDEASFLLNDWTAIGTQQWFSGTIQKMCSITASLFTAYFNVAAEKMMAIRPRPALFDARVFQLPAAEVANYFIWRQQDATRNSVNMLGRFYFSHKEMQGKSTSQVQDMLMERHQVNWNDLQDWMKRGMAVARTTINVPNRLSVGENGADVDTVERRVILPLPKTPIFTKDREVIEKHLQ